MVTNIVLVGRTGNGKSSTGNSLLGRRNVFVSKLGAGGISMGCEGYRAMIQDDTMIKVIDTPGFLDISVSPSCLNNTIKSSLTMGEEGIHVMVHVLSVKNRIGQDEEIVLNTLLAMFGERIVDYLIVVFTGGDVIEKAGMTLDNYLQNGCPEFLENILKRCHGRKVLFDNKTKDISKKNEQVKQFMTHVADIKMRTCGIPYTEAMQREHDKNMVTNIVLVGRTGNGKSSTGNSLLGREVFVSKLGAGGITVGCDRYRAMVQDGKIINVIDTPGILDISLSSSYLNNTIKSCLTIGEEGIHAMVYVLSVKNRIGRDEESVYNTLLTIFGRRIDNYLIVVFTGGDEIKEEDITLDDYLQDGCPEFFKNIFKRCHGRKVLFDNKTKDIYKKNEQVKQFMRHVADVKSRTCGIPFTEAILEQDKAIEALVKMMKHSGCQIF